MNEATVQRLLDVEAIGVLRARYDRAVAEKDWAVGRALHSPSFRSTGNHVVPDKTSDDTIDDIICLVGGSGASIRHSHTPEITVHTATTAEGIWAFEENLFWHDVDGDHWRQSFGFCFETYEKCEGNWLFAKRRLDCSHERTTKA